MVFHTYKPTHEHYIIYFQAYTNTFSGMNLLPLQYTYSEQHIDAAFYLLDATVVLLTTHFVTYIHAKCFNH